MECRGIKQCCRGFWGCGEHGWGYKLGSTAVKPPPSTTIPIQTGRGHFPYLPGHPGQNAGSQPLAHCAQGCPAKGSKLCSAGSPCSTALPVLWSGRWCQASLASCGLGTGHSWEWVQENRKGGSCWPLSGLGPSFPLHSSPLILCLTPCPQTPNPHQVAALLVWWPLLSRPKGLTQRGLGEMSELTHACPEHPHNPKETVDGETEAPPPPQASPQMSLCWPPNSATASSVFSSGHFLTCLYQLV